jgi:hypothetical protein
VGVGGGTGVGAGVATGVGVGAGVGTGVGSGVGSGVGAWLGRGVAEGVGRGVVVGLAVGNGAWLAAGLADRAGCGLAAEAPGEVAGAAPWLDGAEGDGSAAGSALGDVLAGAGEPDGPPSVSPGAVEAGAWVGTNNAARGSAGRFGPARAPERSGSVSGHKTATVASMAIRPITAPSDSWRRMSSESISGHSTHHPHLVHCCAGNPVAWRRCCA